MLNCINSDFHNREVNHGSTHMASMPMPNSHSAGCCDHIRESRSTHEGGDHEGSAVEVLAVAD